MKPEIVVLNEDDANYPSFANFTGNTETFTYGTTRTSTLRIDSAKLYKKGTEANLSLGSSRFSVASFLTGEPIVSYMTCAAAIAASLRVANDVIIDGIANYNPDHIE
jgi:UDP-N-acetylmuramyl pentapeptide synthase